MASYRIKENKIKEIREERGLSRKEVFEHLNIPRSSYFRYENNERQPTEETLFQLARYFEVDIQDLIVEGAPVRKSDNVPSSPPVITNSTSNVNFDKTDKEADAFDNLIRGEIKAMVKKYKKKYQSEGIKQIAQMRQELFELYKNKEYEKMRKVIISVGVDLNLTMNFLEYITPSEKDDKYWFIIANRFYRPEIAAKEE